MKALSARLIRRGQALTVATALAATLLAAGPASAGVGGPSAGAAPEWTQLQGNAAHTGYLSQQNALTPQNVGTPARCGRIR